MRIQLDAIAAPAVPAPPAMPIWPLLKGALRPDEDRAEVALDILSRGDLVRVPFIGRRVYFAKSPADFRRILADNASNYRKSFDYRILADLVGDGLIASEGEIWQRDRRLIEPLFHRKLLAHFTSRILSLAERQLEGWGGEVTVSDEMTRLAINVIGQRVFSEDLAPHAGRIAQLISEAQRHLIDRSIAPIDLAKYLPTPGRIGFDRRIRALDAIFDPLIDRGLDRTNASERFDLLTVLAQGGVPRPAVRDHVRTFFAAGYETSAVALTWILHLLARNPDWQERLAAELKTVLGDRVPAVSDLPQLPLLKAVIDESMRLYPPVPLVGREAIGPDVLSGFPIPAGSTVVLCLLAAHRDPQRWTDPLRFDPARFLGDARKAHQPFSYLPFAAGPRSCIGAQFAMLEISLVLITLLRRFRLDAVPGPEIKPVPLVSLRPSRPVTLKATPRS